MRQRLHTYRHRHRDLHHHSTPLRLVPDLEWESLNLAFLTSEGFDILSSRLTHSMTLQPTFPTLDYIPERLAFGLNQTRAAARGTKPYELPGAGSMPLVGIRVTKEEDGIFDVIRVDGLYGKENGITLEHNEGYHVIHHHQLFHLHQAMSLQQLPLLFEHIPSYSPDTAAQPLRLQDYYIKMRVRHS